MQGSVTRIATFTQHTNKDLMDVVNMHIKLNPPQENERVDVQVIPVVRPAGWFNAAYTEYHATIRYMTD